MTRRSDPNPTYWEQYGPFQHVKHELIRCYLNGWYPKLGTWARRVLYVDTTLVEAATKAATQGHQSSRFRRC
jgi:hypothetical protein